MLLCLLSGFIARKLCISVNFRVTCGAPVYLILVFEMLAVRI